MLNRTSGSKSRQISDATALDSLAQNISTASTDKLKTPSGVRTRAQSRREQQLTPAARVYRSPSPAYKPRAKRTRSFKARSRKSCAKPPAFDTDTDADAEQEAEITPHSAERSDNLETTSGVRTRAQSRRDSLITPTCVAPQNHKPRSTKKKTRKTRRLKTKEVADNCDLSISPSASHSPANRQCHGGQATLELEQQQQQTSSASQPLPSSSVSSVDCTSTPSTTSTRPKAFQLAELCALNWFFSWCHYKALRNTNNSTWYILICSACCSEESMPQGEVNSPLITQSLSTRLGASVNSSPTIAHSSSDNNSSNADQQQEPEEELLEVANRTSSASSERQGNHLSGHDGNSSERPVGLSVALQVQPLTIPHKDADPSPAVSNVLFAGSLCIDLFICWIQLRLVVERKWAHTFTVLVLDIRANNLGATQYPTSIHLTTIRSCDCVSRERSVSLQLHRRKRTRKPMRSEWHSFEKCAKNNCKRDESMSVLVVFTNVRVLCRYCHCTGQLHGSPARRGSSHLSLILEHLCSMKGPSKRS